MLNFLIIFCVNFKICLRVIAHRTDLRSFYAYNDMTAVTALPNLNFTLFKNLFCFNVMKQCTITFFVSFFYCGYHTELFSQFGKAFDAKYVYLLRACDSPEKAVLKFSSVFVPEYLFAIYITSVNLLIYNIYHYTRILNNIFLCLAFFRFLY